jgi:hypothetical protein
MPNGYYNFIYFATLLNLVLFRLEFIHHLKQNCYSFISVDVVFPLIFALRKNKQATKEQKSLLCT